jgi:hypothetical protein
MVVKQKLSDKKQNLFVPDGNPGASSAGTGGPITNGTNGCGVATASMVDGRGATGSVVDAASETEGLIGGVALGSTTGVLSTFVLSPLLSLLSLFLLPSLEFELLELESMMVGGGSTG